eukprot:m.60333 g.60333  ORF g.60333 m.60333 type:complete len:320 (+) comp13079_c0_seq4:394-1353(+)
MHTRARTASTLTRTRTHTQTKTHTHTHTQITRWLFILLTFYAQVESESAEAAAEAEKRFRQLVSVAGVLKDSDLRKEYNRILVEGLPSWRNPLYYYRASAKLGLSQVIGLVLLFGCVVQYVGAWGTYFERSMALRELAERENERANKRSKGKTSVVVHQAPKPRILDLFVFSIPVALFRSLAAIPTQMKQHREEQQRVQAEQLEAQQEAEEEEEAREEAAREAREKKEKRKRAKQEEARVREEKYRESLRASTLLSVQAGKRTKAASASNASLLTGPFSEAELRTLTQLVTKFPSGTSDRWQKIAGEMNRKVADVTSQV